MYIDDLKSLLIKGRYIKTIWEKKNTIRNGSEETESFSGTEDWTQSFTHASQMLYHQTAQPELHNFLKIWHRVSPCGPRLALNFNALAATCVSVWDHTWNKYTPYQKQWPREGRMSLVVILKWGNFKNSLSISTDWIH